MYGLMKMIALTANITLFLAFEFKLKNHKKQVAIRRYYLQKLRLNNVLSFYPMLEMKSEVEIIRTIRKHLPMEVTQNKRPTKSVKNFTDVEKWQALATRDHTADDIFYFSVKTTGIYCRPSCSARPARRENIAFHATCADAEQAGFRPCKRCRPNETTLFKRHIKTIQQVCEIIEHSEEPPTLSELAKSVGMSRYYFHRIFKTIVGITPKAYVIASRAKKIRQHLMSSDTITQAIYDAGFNSNGRFYATATHRFGMTPSEFRKGGSNISICFCITKCTLGAVLIAVSSKGICEISLDKNPALLMRNFQDHYPKADLIDGNHEFEDWAIQKIAFIDTHVMDMDLPLEVRCIAFQQRLWHALNMAAIKFAITPTSVAHKTGNIKTHNTVANACAPSDDKRIIERAVSIN